MRGRVAKQREASVARTGEARSARVAALRALAWSALFLAFAFAWWSRAYLHEQSFKVVGLQGQATLDGDSLQEIPAGTLYDGARFATGPDSALSLRFEDGSLLQLGPDARLQVLEARSSASRTRYRTHLRLVAGELAGRSPADNGDVRRESELGTPGFKLEVQGVDFAATVDDKAARASVLRGTATLITDDGQPRPLAAAHGTAVSSGAIAPQEATELLPPPALAEPAASARIEDPAVRFSWEPVPGAVGYLLEVAADGDRFDAIVARRRVDTPSVELASLPFDAPFRWRVATLDARGLRGVAAEPRTLQYKHYHRLLRERNAAGHADAALQVASAALLGYPDDAALIGDIGWSHTMAGDFTEARREFDRAVALKPANLTLLSRRGRLLYWLKDYAAARADYEQALQLAPDDAEALWGRAEVLLAQDDTAAAIADLQKALAKDPAHPHASLTLARALAPTDPVHARQWLERHLAAHPDDPAAIELKVLLRPASQRGGGSAATVPAAPTATP